eukprot:gb/GECG01006168.1/.p1 GENE.gb/GECG01006168.1/~~gb/GECG01006168.1/.p1  ORF type:complete len:1130 (+),score=134.31 gb/GECG01006168.1/:1-3390(+)
MELDVIEKETFDDLLSEGESVLQHIQNYLDWDRFDVDDNPQMTRLSTLGEHYDTWETTVWKRLASTPGQDSSNTQGVNGLSLPFVFALTAVGVELKTFDSVFMTLQTGLRRFFSWARRCALMMDRAQLQSLLSTKKWRSNDQTGISQMEFEKHVMLRFSDTSPNDHTSERTLANLQKLRDYYDRYIPFTLVFGEQLKQETEKAEQWFETVSKTGLQSGEEIDKKLVQSLLRQGPELLVACESSMNLLRNATLPQCICRRPWSGSMLQCGSCKMFFHSDCFNRTKDECQTLLERSKNRTRAFNRLITGKNSFEAVKGILPEGESNTENGALEDWKCPECLAHAGINAAIVKCCWSLSLLHSEIKEERVQLTRGPPSNQSLRDSVESTVAASQAAVTENDASKATEKLHQVSTTSSLDWLCCVEDVLSAFSKAPSSDSPHYENVCRGQRWLLEEEEDAKHGETTAPVGHKDSSIVSPQHIETLIATGARRGVYSLNGNGMSSGETSTASADSISEDAILWSVLGHQVLFDNPPRFISRLAHIVKVKKEEDGSTVRAWENTITHAMEGFHDAGREERSSRIAEDAGIKAVAFVGNEVREADYPQKIAHVLRCLRLLVWYTRFRDSLKSCVDEREIHRCLLSAIVFRLPSVYSGPFTPFDPLHNLRGSSMSANWDTLLSNHTFLLSIGSVLCQGMWWRQEAKPLLRMTGPVSVKKYQNLLIRARNIPMLLAEEPQVESVVLDGGQAYCICGGLSDGRFMIACEYSSPHCKQWYHAECVGVPVPETNVPSPGETVASNIRSGLRASHRIMPSGNESDKSQGTDLQEEIEQEDFKCPVCALAHKENYKYKGALPQESIRLLQQSLGPDEVHEGMGHANAANSGSIPNKKIGCCYAAAQGVGVNAMPSRPQPYCFLPLSVGMSEAAEKNSRITVDAGSGARERVVVALPFNNTWLSQCAQPDEGTSCSVLQRNYGLVPNTKKFSEHLRQALRASDPSSTRNSLLDVDVYSDGALFHMIRSLQHDPSFRSFEPSDAGKLLEELVETAKSRNETTLWVAGVSDACASHSSTIGGDAINDSIQQGIIEYIYHVGGADAALAYCEGLKQSRLPASKRGNGETDETPTSSSSERPKRRRLS